MNKVLVLMQKLGYVIFGVFEMLENSSQLLLIFKLLFTQDSDLVIGR
jgi:hypothetical protein